MCSIIGTLFCEFCVFVTCVGLLYDKLWHNIMGVSIQPHFPTDLRVQRCCKEWRSLTLGQMWQKSGKCNVSELENQMNKFKHYKKKFFKSCYTLSYMYYLSVCATDMPQDVLSSTCWSCTTWYWFKGKKKEYTNFLMPKQWIWGRLVIQWQDKTL